MRPIEILYKKNATKAQLRYALAECLNVEWHEPTENTAPQTTFKQCLKYFLNEYKTATQLEYAFSPKHAIALKGILTKLERVSATEDVTETFMYLIKHLPAWYKQNAFSLCVINSKFNEITATIKTNKKISNEYKQDIINSLFK
ncbi:hypothetical protein BWK63_13695 [Flavobacterium covae]|uniref:hypothetical protein n=1 Tax=Flavobacterium TaxID=237 RepID=UPI000B4C2F53|nr:MULTISPECIES: hypothetical protein [Flavobacterium]OWP79936.1 hypothetical protein BWK63_13695 [Flavobacterium covae]POR19870.1 hypothetical protein BWK57_13430 [Flavobacterium columnare]